MTDRFTIRTVVVALAAGVIITLGAMTWLASTQTPIPDALDRLGFLLAGGLVGVLASTRSGDEPTPVTGVDGAPVQVEEAGYGAIELLVVVVIIVILLRVIGLI